jgi:ribosome-associated protein
MNDEVMQVENLKNQVVQILEDMKAQDVKVLDVRQLTDITDIMVIASGTSVRHVKSMAFRVRDEVREKTRVRPIGVEGEDQGDWVLIDLGDVVVHIMRPETREYYDLERLWNREVEELVRLNREKSE